MGQMRIFVSHSHEDKDFCDALVRALRGAGADVWYDEHNLGAGQLLDEIMHELRARSVFIVILSKAALSSSWVMRECKWAYNLYDRDRSRILLPVVRERIEPNDFDVCLFLEEFKRIEAPGDLPYSTAEAIERTLHLLALQPIEPDRRPIVPQIDESVEDLLSHGNALSLQGKHRQALDFFSCAAQLAPTRAQVWRVRADTLSSLGRYDEALADYEKALDRDGMDAAAWIGKGNVLSSVQLYNQALVAYDAALSLGPKQRQLGLV